MSTITHANVLAFETKHDRLTLNVLVQSNEESINECVRKMATQLDPEFSMTDDELDDEISNYGWIDVRGGFYRIIVDHPIEYDGTMEAF